MAWTEAETKAYYDEKDTIFRAQVQLDQWPSDRCETCQKRPGCCERYSHHVGDCCLHCGNDERSGPGLAMKFRGR